MMTNEPAPTVSVKEAAEMLDVHEQTVRGYVKDGLLKKRQVKRKARVRIFRRSVEAMLADGAPAPDDKKPADESPSATPANPPSR